MQEIDIALAQSLGDNKPLVGLIFQRVVYDTVKAPLGKQDKKHKYWFDPNDQMLHDLMKKGPRQPKSVADLLSKLTKMPAEYYGNTHGLECLNGRK